MAPSTIRKALGTVKDQTSIGLAKVSNNTSLSDLEVAIVKATRHDEHPADEKYLREILSLTSYSRAYISACVNTLSKRLNKTQNWIVALKTLILIQRLLSEGDPAHEQEIFFSTRRGTRILNMSDFRDTSRSMSWDYSSFVRTFSLYLDERLEFRMHGRKGLHMSSLGDDDDEEMRATATASTSICSTPVRDMKIERIFSRSQHLQQLLERFLACRPTGMARNHRIVMVALYPLVKESVQIYFDVTEIMGILIDRFMELQIPDCMKVYEIFCRLAKQFEELDLFYSWCKTVGVARSSDYPQVERITQKKLEIMEEFIREKQALSKRKASDHREPTPEAAVEEVEETVEDEMNSIKALPAPESFVEADAEENEESKQEDENTNNSQEEADLLNLKEDGVTGEQEGDKLALALFAGDSSSSSAQPWEAFPANGESSDWETALVESISNLPNQKATLGGGFNMLVLDGMYEHSTAATVAAAVGGTGSASSVAFIAGAPTMLALPAPPVSGNGGGPGGDPFAASLGVAPPAYIQMSDMEKKQHLLVQEQLMWQQFSRDGMQGQPGMANQQLNQYAMGGYTQSY